VRDPSESLLHALFRQSGVNGVNARTGLFEQVVDGLGLLITKVRDPGAEVLRFPPITSRAHIEKSGYLHSFPHLLGAVCCLAGSEQEILAAVEGANSNGSWTAKVSPTDLVLAPAACYPLYPLAAARGKVPMAGLIFDVASDCFRHEPSRQIDRLQSFRMREFVRIGTPEQAFDFRQQWIPRAQEIADELGLASQVAPANDPFFGRTGRMLAMSQVEQALKFELLIPVRSDEQPTACMSFNCHREHFGKTWGIATEDGAVAHTACVAFGIDRLVLALFSRHGTDLARWPAQVRKALSL
jgi:seryl-tRNA synthetase